MSIDPRAHYAASHEYARPEGDMLVIGISDHAQAELGDIVFVELPQEGKAIGKGQTFGTVESVKAASDLYMPVGGKVTAVNTALQADPALVNREPYEGGWMIKILPSDKKELDQLLDAKSYGATIGEE
ncbi:MAG: glycine cleavage system protein GcvH [Spirochaetaceae bacterium]|nr:glycine cleavage system protein GcvH [Spirochaetaceae bacterium]